MSQVTLSEYSAEWRYHFRCVAAELTAIASLAAHIEHIGSTSVVGLCAKPVIDIMLGVAKLSDIKLRIPTIETLGYVYRAEYELALPERRYFVRAANVTPRVHLHCVLYRGQLWVQHLAFRDALRADAQLARQYQVLKHALAALHAGDKVAYSAAKSLFIAQVLSSPRCVRARAF